MLEVKEYLTASGVSPFGEWFRSLEPKMQARIAAVTQRMTQGNFGDHKSAGASVMETRIDTGPGYRIYYGRDGMTIVILVAGGTKRTQDKDIQDAQARWKDYKARKARATSTPRKK